MPKTNKYEYKPVVVLWEDIMYHGKGWTHSKRIDSAIEDNAGWHYLVGWLVRKTDTHIYITDQYKANEKEEIHEFWEIPLRVVKKITYLK